MRQPLALRAYATIARAASPLAPIFLDWRARRGKEDVERRSERMGVAGAARPKGSIAWVHGASVGETVSLLPLVNRLRANSVQVLMTSGTVTSAGIMQRRLPPGAWHQYVPLDSPLFADRFIAHWRPDIALFAESEIWPNLFASLKRARAPLALVNARMSERSYQRWRRAGGVARTVLGDVDMVLAQSDEDAFRFGALGAPHVKVAGNLKFDGPPPPADSVRLGEMSAAVAGRPLWFAASTHPGEDDAVIAAHHLIAEQFPDVLTIIAPRHPDRGGEIAEIATMDGLSVALRSRDGLPRRGTGVYVADTLGEMGLFYRLSPIALVGGTLVDIGGHNPLEAAKLSVAILHGPHVKNAADSYAALDRGGAMMVADADALAREVVSLLSDAAGLRAMGDRAFAIVDALTGATDRSFESIAPLLSLAPAA
ncbi:MAG: 3-deoxy-D-manno-octulosonic acid transferase [Beijerinckiaceae bacterium]